MRRRPRHSLRRTHQTLFLVGEGKSECAFLQHAKALYVSRSAGLKVTIACAHGKGAAHVVDVAIRKSASIAYDKVAVMLDTDTGWTPGVERRARSRGLHLLCSIPMFEAMLLRICGQPAEGNSSTLKKQFRKLIGNNDGYHPDHYHACYSDEVLQAAATQEDTIRVLLELLHARPVS